MKYEDTYHMVLVHLHFSQYLECSSWTDLRCRLAEPAHFVSWRVFPRVLSRDGWLRLGLDLEQRSAESPLVRASVPGGAWTPGNTTRVYGAQDGSGQEEHRDSQWQWSTVNDRLGGAIDNVRVFSVKLHPSFLTTRRQMLTFYELNVLASNG